MVSSLEYLFIDKEATFSSSPEDLLTFLILELLPVPVPGRERKGTMTVDLGQSELHSYTGASVHLPQVDGH